MGLTWNPAFPQWLPFLTDQTKIETLLSLAPTQSNSVIGPGHNLSQSQPSISIFKQFPKSKFLEALRILPHYWWEKKRKRIAAELFTKSWTTWPTCAKISFAWAIWTVISPNVLLHSDNFLMEKSQMFTNLPGETNIEICRSYCATWPQMQHNSKACMRPEHIPKCQLSSSAWPRVCFSNNLTKMVAIPCVVRVPKPERTELSGLVTEPNNLGTSLPSWFVSRKVPATVFNSCYWTNKFF